LLDALVTHCPLAALSPYMGTVWNLLLHRMQEMMKDTKTPRYCRSFVHTLCLYAAIHGGQVRLSPWLSLSLSVSLSLTLYLPGG